MTAVLPDVARIDFRELFERDRLGRVRDEDFTLLDEAILAKPDDAVIAFDLRDLEYLGYSFVKQTIRKALRRRGAGEYDRRQLIINADQGREFLDGLEAALREQKLFMLVAPGPDTLDQGRLVGAVPTYLEDTFSALRDLGEATTGTLARTIGESLQNTKNRLDRLFEMGLLRREKVASPTGGREWKNRVF